MGKPSGFMEFTRELPSKRPPQERVRDWKPFEQRLPESKLKTQGARCMDCGTPYCHSACPVANLIPDWNDLAYRGRWAEALDRLHATNNFPEFTGLVCPAPCENSCTLGVETYEQPVTIKQLELAIIEKGFQENLVLPRKAAKATGKSVAVAGSGPSGLACAQQLARMGHAVTVFEKSDRPGGLLRYGIPEFKLEKSLVARRVKQMEAEGVKFVTQTEAGVAVKAAQLREDYDALVLCNGAGQPRDLKAEGRGLKGIYFALEFLTQANRISEGDKIGDQVTAKDKNVIVIGGGDTGADCISTALRQGAKSVTTLEILAKPPLRRDPDNPWPQWARIQRKASAHEEGGEILYSVKAKKFGGDNGAVKSVQVVELDWMPQIAGPARMLEVPGSAKELPVDLVLLAMGFGGPEKSALLKDLNLELDNRGNVKTGEDKMTSQKGVFAAGDVRRGQSLVVWAIAEGRQAAESVDRYLMG